MPALTIDAARAALQRGMRQDHGLALDQLDPVRVESFLRRAPDVGTVQHVNQRPAMLALASGSRGETAAAAVLPYLPTLLKEASRRRSGQRLRLWMVGAATGSGPQDVADLVRLVRGSEQDCIIVATDPDPVALTRLDVRGGAGVELVLQAGCPTAAQPTEERFDLVLCRDLMRFLHASRIDDVYDKLVDRLDASGALVVHGADPMPPSNRRMESSWRGGARIYHRSAAPAQDGVATQLQRGAELLAQGKLDEAVGLALRLASEAPDEVTAQIFAARACLHMGLFAEGLKHARGAARLEPTAVMPALLELELARALGDLGAARLAQAQAETLLAARLPSVVLPYGAGLTAASMRERLAG